MIRHSRAETVAAAAVLLLLAALFCGLPSALYTWTIRAVYLSDCAQSEE